MTHAGSDRWSDGFRRLVEYHIRRTNIEGLLEIGFETSHRNASRAPPQIASSAPYYNIVQPEEPSPVYVNMKPCHKVKETKSIKNGNHDISFIDTSKFTPGCVVCQVCV